MRDALVLYACSRGCCRSEKRITGTACPPPEDRVAFRLEQAVQAGTLVRAMRRKADPGAGLPMVRLPAPSRRG